MDSKENIYKNLISHIEEEKNEISKKDIFLENLNFVKKLLLSGMSTKKQIEQYSKKIDKISRSSYEKYCKEFLKKQYEQGLLNSLFYRNIKTIAYYLSHTKNPCSKQLYLNLQKSGSLKLARNKKDSSLDYSTFVDILKDFLKQKGYENLITFEENKLQNEPIINSKTTIENKSENKTEVELDTKEDEKIKIEFFDGNFDTFDKSFLKTDFLVQEDSYIDNNIKEKNAYYIQARYIDKEYSFENFKKLIKSKDIIENYSIIIHNNSSIDTRLYIYRFVDNTLLMLKSLDASSCVFELDELIRRSRSNFFKKFDGYLNEIISN